MARTDTASRVISASPADVYTAMVDAAALAKWLPPANMTADFERFDPRPGGSYRLVLTYIDGSGSVGKASENSDIVEGRFVDLIPGERVVQAVDFESDDPAFHGTMTMTWQVAPHEDGARVDFIADDVPDGISAEDHAEGMEASLSNLARYLES